jgi:hypothetical protein
MDRSLDLLNELLSCCPPGKCLDVVTDDPVLLSQWNEITYWRPKNFE